MFGSVMIVMKVTIRIIMVVGIGRSDWDVHGVLGAGFLQRMLKRT